MSVPAARITFAPLAAYRPRLAGAAALAALRERPDAGEQGPGPPLPWYQGGLGETGAALPVSWQDNGSESGITGCGANCSGACGLSHDAPGLAVFHSGNGHPRSAEVLCPGCGGPFDGPGSNCRTPHCDGRAPGPPLNGHPKAAVRAAVEVR